MGSLREGLVEYLAPLARRFPQPLGLLMRALSADYITACQHAGIPPDPAVLALLLPFS